MAAGHEGMFFFYFSLHPVAISIFMLLGKGTGGYHNFPTAINVNQFAMFDYGVLEALKYNGDMVQPC